MVASGGGQKMKSVVRRIGWLEERFAPEPDEELLQVLLTHLDRKLAGDLSVSLRQRLG
jgi:hypothetical protein